MLNAKIITESIVSVIKEVLNNENLTINNETNLITDLGMDSISLMMLVVYIEDQYQIILPDDFFTIDKLSSVDIIVKTICELLNISLVDTSV